MWPFLITSFKLIYIYMQTCTHVCSCKPHCVLKLGRNSAFFLSTKFRHWLSELASTVHTIKVVFLDVATVPLFANNSMFVSKTSLTKVQLPWKYHCYILISTRNIVTFTLLHLIICYIEVLQYLEIYIFIYWILQARPKQEKLEFKNRVTGLTVWTAKNTKRT